MIKHVTHHSRGDESSSEHHAGRQHVTDDATHELAAAIAQRKDGGDDADGGNVEAKRWRSHHSGGGERETVPGEVIARVPHENAARRGKRTSELRTQSRKNVWHVRWARSGRDEECDVFFFFFPLKNLFCRLPLFSHLRNTVSLTRRKAFV